MTKPRISKLGMFWRCRTVWEETIGFGLTPTDAYAKWLQLHAARISTPLAPLLAPMQEPVAPCRCCNCRLRTHMPGPSEYYRASIFDPWNLHPGRMLI